MRDRVKRNGLQFYIFRIDAVALWLLRRAVIKRRLSVFGVYCLAVGAITLVAVGFNWIK